MHVTSDRRCVARPLILFALIAAAGCALPAAPATHRADSSATGDSMDPFDTRTDARGVDPLDALVAEDVAAFDIGGQQLDAASDVVGEAVPADRELDASLPDVLDVDDVRADVSTNDLGDALDEGVRESRDAPEISIDVLDVAPIPEVSTLTDVAVETLDNAPVIDADMPDTAPVLIADTGPTYDSGHSDGGAASSDCGGNGQACCVGGACGGINRSCMQQPSETMPFCRDCGGNGEPCCDYGACMGADRICQLRAGEPVPHCRDCGGNGQPCCAYGRCDTGRFCVTGTSYSVCR